jgi:hypothetical protein
MEMQMGEKISERLARRVLLKHSNVNDLQRELLMLRSPILRTFEDIANLLRTLDRPEMLNRAQGSTKNYATFHDSNDAQVDEEAHEYDENHVEGDTDDECLHRMSRAILSSTSRTRSFLNRSQWKSWNTILLTEMFDVICKNVAMSEAL